MKNKVGVRVDRTSPHISTRYRSATIVLTDHVSEIIGRSVAAEMLCGNSIQNVEP